MKTCLKKKRKRSFPCLLRLLHSSSEGETDKLQSLDCFWEQAPTAGQPLGLLGKERGQAPFPSPLIAALLAGALCLDRSCCGGHDDGKGNPLPTHGPGELMDQLRGRPARSMHARHPQIERGAGRRAFGQASPWCRCLVPPEVTPSLCPSDSCRHHVTIERTQNQDARCAH